VRLKIGLALRRLDGFLIIKGRDQDIDENFYQIEIMKYTSIMNERITIEAGKRSGQPCIRGMRITVKDVLEYLAGGMSREEILADFPNLEKEDITACLDYAAHREEHLSPIAV
jgi:uncharacterized protein (DUF433 family)